MHMIASTTPRHASTRTLPQRLRTIYRWIDRQMDKEMSGAACALCGAVMGLMFGPLLFFCYFG